MNEVSNEDMNESIQTLIEGCRRKERRAQQAVYERYAHRIYAACLRITGRSEEAEEAMQDAFLKAFERIGQFDSERCFEAWLQRIAVRTAIDHVRSQSEMWEALPDGYAEQAEEETDDEEHTHLTVEAIRRAMQQLADGYRIVLSLYLFEGYDMDEIASILKLQPASVRSQYLRGKRKLVELIRNEQWTD